VAESLVETEGLETSKTDEFTAILDRDIISHSMENTIWTHI